MDMISTNVTLEDDDLLLHADPANVLTSRQRHFSGQDRVTVLRDPDEVVFDVMNRMSTTLVFKNLLGFSTAW